MIEMPRAQRAGRIVCNYVDVPQKGVSKATKIFVAILATAIFGGALFMWVALGKHLFTFDGNSPSSPLGLSECLLAIVGTCLSVAFLKFGWTFATKKVGFDRTITVKELDQIKRGDIVTARNLLCREEGGRNTDLTLHVREGRLTSQQKAALCRAIESYDRLWLEYVHRSDTLCEPSMGEHLVLDDLALLIEQQQQEWPQKRDQLFGQVR